MKKFMNFEISVRKESEYIVIFGSNGWEYEIPIKWVRGDRNFWDRHLEEKRWYPLVKNEVQGLFDEVCSHLDRDSTFEGKVEDVNF